MAVAVPVALAVAVVVAVVVAVAVPFPVGDAVAARQVGERRREAGEGEEGGGSSALFKTSTQPRRVGKQIIKMIT